MIRKTGVARWMARFTLIAAALGFLLTFNARSQSVASSYIPFTATVQTQYFGAKSGPARATEYATVARKADGSQAQIDTVHSPNGQPGRTESILDVHAREAVGLEGFTKSKTTYHYTSGQLDAMLQTENCSRNVARGAARSELLGQEVFRIRSIETHGNLKATETIWVAPRLGCFPLRDVYKLSSGPWTEEKVLRLKLGEPSRSLFQIPAGYAERSPSQLAARWLALFPGHPWATDSAIQRMNEIYSMHR